jgi:hypothetical protein
VNNKSAVFIAMGFECFGLITVCVLIGRWLDQKYGWGSLAAGLGAFVGLSAWVAHLLLLLKSLAKSGDSGHTGPE